MGENGGMSSRSPVARIAPRLVPRVWGGDRLRALADAAGGASVPPGPIGEAWFGEANERAGDVLVKLLDVRERLSVQVHPGDALAVELHGAGALGKHEAWVILDAAPGAELLLGRDAAAAPDALAAAIATGDGVERLLARLPVRAGDVFDVPAGMLHALLPGLLVWEVQQPSERTYRVADWGRDDPSRPLQRTEALRALDVAAVAAPPARIDWARPGAQPLLSTQHFSIAAYIGPYRATISARDGVATLVAAPPGAGGAPAAASIGGLPLRPLESTRLADPTAVELPPGSALIVAIGVPPAKV